MRSYDNIEGKKRHGDYVGYCAKGAVRITGKLLHERRI